MDTQVLQLAKGGFMTISNWLMILAVFLAPFLAIFAQRKIDEIKERRNQKLWVFRALMSTRGNKLSLEHVQALNSIDLFFEKKGNEKGVIEKWEEYFDYLELKTDKDDPEYKIKYAAWAEKKDELFAALLSLMAKSLGYDFDVVKIKKGAYTPQGHSDVWLDQRIVQKGLADIMLGVKGFPIQVQAFPPAKEEVSSTLESILRGLADILSGVKGFPIQQFPIAKTDKPETQSK